MPDKAKTSPPAAKGSEAPQGQNVGAHLPNRKSIIIGRGLDCDVVISDAKASRRHCKLTRQGTNFLLEDLKSKNGTFVNGERISDTVTLNSRQTFKIGDTMFYLGT